MASGLVETLNVTSSMNFFVPTRDSSNVEGRIELHRMLNKEEENEFKEELLNAIDPWFETSTMIDENGATRRTLKDAVANRIIFKGRLSGEPDETPEDDNKIEHQEHVPNEEQSSLLMAESSL